MTIDPEHSGKPDNAPARALYSSHAARERARRRGACGRWRVSDQGRRRQHHRQPSRAAGGRKPDREAAGCGRGRASPGQGHAGGVLRSQLSLLPQGLRRYRDAPARQLGPAARAGAVPGARGVVDPGVAGRVCRCAPSAAEVLCLPPQALRRARDHRRHARTRCGQSDRARHRQSDGCGQRGRVGPADDLPRQAR